MKNVLKIVAVLLFVTNVSFGQKKEVDSLINTISNKDAYILLARTTSPRISGVASNKIVKIGKTATPQLITVLDTADKGIIAHFILSEIWKEKWEEEICCNIRRVGGIEIIRVNGLEVLIENDVLSGNTAELIRNKESWTKFYTS